MSVIKLVTPEKKEPSKDAVDLLSDFLKLAKKGEVTEVALVAIYSDQRHELAFTPSNLSALMLGAVTRLQHSLSEKIGDIEYDAPPAETTEP